MATGVTGEAKSGPLRLEFDRSVKVEFQVSAISSDGGLLLHRELDDALGLTDMAAGLLGDMRAGRNGRHRLASFLRTLATPELIERWSLTSLRERLIKTGHASCVMAVTPSSRWLPPYCPERSSPESLI